MIIADLWMPTISGVQLCRLLRSEAGTANVPIVLCGDDDAPRSRFWAERAGASSYVLHGRTGDLMRAIDRAVGSRAPEEDDGFFVQLGGTDVRERIARQLDRALYESVIASELRALARCGSFERFFDAFVQLVSQLARYRWIAVATAGGRFAIHHHPSIVAADAEAKATLRLAHDPTIRIEDHDASDDEAAMDAITIDITFADTSVARLAISAAAEADLGELESLLAIVSAELGMAIKMALLVEESHLLATTDVLTGLMNRRAFLAAMAIEHARAVRYGSALSLALVDIDHFKHINDGHGHGTGDAVLAAVGKLLRGLARETDLVARWGGEEIVVAFTSTDLEGACKAAERLRSGIAKLEIRSEVGAAVPVTASFGVAQLEGDEPIARLMDRADQAMYASKRAGRDRVTAADAAPASAKTTVAVA